VKKPVVVSGAVVATLWIVLLLCTWWEPILHDGWGATIWLRDHPPTAESVWVFFRDSYNGSNPRLGQTLTLLMYEPGPWHVIATPLAELALFSLLTVLAIGRWPSPRRLDDALAFATVAAITVVVTPEIGQMLFYRPYVGNYTMGLLLNVAWLVPYRLAPPRARLWWAPAMLVLGALAGLCNEHTGPAFAGAAVLAVYATRRRGDRIAAWMIAGIVGLVAGYVALLVAPGHDYRYGGLATKQSTLAMVAERGVGGNLAIAGWLVFFVANAAPWIGLGLLRRGERRDPAHLVLIGAGVLAMLALLASPKVGDRLYLASTALIAAGIAGWLMARLEPAADAPPSPAARGAIVGVGLAIGAALAVFAFGVATKRSERIISTSIGFLAMALAAWLAGARPQRARTVCAVFAAAALGFVCMRCVDVYSSVAAIGAERRELIEHAAPGSTVHLRRYPVSAGTWFRGEDFEISTVRENVIRSYQLGAIDLD
jgi:hypothetical protein